MIPVLPSLGSPYCCLRSKERAVCVAFATRLFSYVYSDGSRFILYLFAKQIICSDRLAMKKSEMDVLVIWG